MTIDLNSNNVSRLYSVVNFLSELIRFNIFKPKHFFYCINRLWNVRNIDTIELICHFWEYVGALLLTKKKILSKVNREIDRLKNVCDNKFVDSDCAIRLMNTYYILRPSERPKIVRKELSPYHRYLLYLLNEELLEEGKEEEIASHILHYKLNDMNTLMMIVEEIIKVSFSSCVHLENLAGLCYEISINCSWFIPVLLDTIYEKILFILDFVTDSTKQEFVGLIEFISYLYEFRLIKKSSLFSFFYLLIEYGHDVLILFIHSLFHSFTHSFIHYLIHYLTISLSFSLIHSFL